MLVKYFMLINILLISLICDIKTCKIKNLYITLFSVLGCLGNLVIYGKRGLLQSIAGFFLPIILLFLLFALKMLGAGDIKLLAAIGSIMGFRFAVYNIAYSFLAGGMIAFLLLLTGRNAMERLKTLSIYLKSCFLFAALQDYEGFKRSEGSGFRFTYAIVPATILQAAVMLLG